MGSIKVSTGCSRVLSLLTTFADVTRYHAYTRAGTHYHTIDLCRAALQLTTKSSTPHVSLYRSPGSAGLVALIMHDLSTQDIVATFLSEIESDTVVSFYHGLQINLC